MFLVWGSLCPELRELQMIQCRVACLVVSSHGSRTDGRNISRRQMLVGDGFFFATNLAESRMTAQNAARSTTYQKVAVSDSPTKHI